MPSPHHPASALVARRAKAAAALASLDAVVVVASGEPIGIPGGQDQQYPFVPWPEYRWLSGRDHPGSFVAWDPRDGPGAWVDFVPPVSEAERLWEGRSGDADPGARPVGELAAWLAHREGHPVIVLGGAIPTVSTEPEKTARAAELLLHARRRKDRAEIALLRKAVAATERAFTAARAAIAPGVSEQAVAAALEHAARAAGADAMGYGTIVASGPRSAILHGVPTERVIGAGEFVLIDAGAALEGYTADVTRTYASSPLDGPRRDLHAVVARAQRRAVAGVRPGVAWRDVHRGAARDMAEGLIAMGVLRGTASDLVEREAMAMFFPHGIGHMVGLGVRDAGGRLPGAAPGPSCCGVRLRVDLPLEEGYLMTVEPGLYFVPALLRDAGRRERFADCVDWDFVDRLLDAGIGGVRIEDDVLVLREGGENLTAAIRGE